MMHKTIDNPNFFDSLYAKHKSIQLGEIPNNGTPEKNKFSRPENIDIFLKVEEDNSTKNLTSLSANKELSHKYINNSESFHVNYDETNKENLGKKRGPYKKYSPSKKKQALDIFYSSKNSENGERTSTKSISKTLDIPCNTLKRWVRVGIYRRKGAGRKLLDPEMESKVNNWINDKYETDLKKIDTKTVRKIAKSFATTQNFKASKGWMSGFIKRFNLETKVNYYPKI